MQSRWMRRLGLAGLVAFGMWTSVGCAQERAPINRVQANALSKHFFVGAEPERHDRRPRVLHAEHDRRRALRRRRRTASSRPVVRAAALAHQVGDPGDVLIARLTYERIQDSDHYGAQTTEQRPGRRRVQDHEPLRHPPRLQPADRRSSSTSSSRTRPTAPGTSASTSASTGRRTSSPTLRLRHALAGSASSAASSSTRCRTTSRTRTTRTRRSSTPTTATSTSRPRSFATPQIGRHAVRHVPRRASSRPTSAATAPGRSTATRPRSRSASRSRRSSTTTTSPRTGTATSMDAFGWFTVDRYGYDRNYGIVDENWHRFAAKYNIWQKSHVDGRAVRGRLLARRERQRPEVQGRRQAAASTTDPTTGLPDPRSPNGPAVHAGSCRRLRRAPRHRRRRHRGRVPVHGRERQRRSTRARAATSSRNKCDLPLYERTDQDDPAGTTARRRRRTSSRRRRTRSTRGTSR